MDQNEVDFHSNLAQGWWNLNGPVAPLHSLNDIRYEFDISCILYPFLLIHSYIFRVPFIRDGLISTNRVKKENIKSPKPLEGVKILEVGCGAGILTEVINIEIIIIRILILKKEKKSIAGPSSNPRKCNCT